MDDPKSDTQDQDSKQPQDKLSQELKALEEARKNIGQGWLLMEREKSRLSAAINSMPLGFIISDETNKIIKTNPQAEKIFNGKNYDKLLDLEENFKGDFNLSEESFRCMRERQTIISKKVPFKGKNLRFFLSPLIILKESLAVLGTVIVIEEIPED